MTVVDQPASYRVTDSAKRFTGKVITVRTDSVEMPAGQLVQRDVVVHPGAVGVIALDEQERVLLIQQYRHPVRAFEWEPPAGLLDEAGETPWLAAARELAEEADLVAARWDTLAEYFSSPGGSDEALRIYLARDLTSVAEGDRYERHGEEMDMPSRWVDLDDALDAVLSGQLHNPSAVVGILAAHASRARGWSTLRPHDAPWPAHPAYRAAD